MDSEAVASCAGAVLLRVKLQPKTSRNAVVEACTAWYRIALTAPPVNGAANDALVRFVASTLDISRQQVELSSGRQSRNKTLRITGTDAATVRRLMDSAIRR